MARMIITGDEPLAVALATVDDAAILSRRIGRELALEMTFGVDYRGEVCKRSFDGWRTINMCNSGRGEIFTRRPVR